MIQNIDLYRDLWTTSGQWCKLWETLDQCFSTCSVWRTTKQNKIQVGDPCSHVVLRKLILMTQSELLRPTSLWVPNATRRRLPIVWEPLHLYDTNGCYNFMHCFVIYNYYLKKIFGRNTLLTKTKLTKFVRPLRKKGKTISVASCKKCLFPIWPFNLWRNAQKYVMFFQFCGGRPLFCSFNFFHHAWPCLWDPPPS